jgi:hypothetical protein
MTLTIRRTFILGSMIGDLLAIGVGIVLLLPFPFSHGLHLRLITIGAWLCPFYVLMFMSVVHSISAVVMISLVGNAALYGGLAVLVRVVYRFYWACWSRLARRDTGPL